jgi:hypothetical protein
VVIVYFEIAGSAGGVLLLAGVKTTSRCVVPDFRPTAQLYRFKKLFELCSDKAYVVCLEFFRTSNQKIKKSVIPAAQATERLRELCFTAPVVLRPHKPQRALHLF